MYDGFDLIEIRDILDVPMARVVFGPGIDNPLAMIELNGSGAETARYYYHTDHLGSVRLLTDGNGAVAETYDYSAYGVRLDDPAADTTLNPFHYTGREYHAPSGLYFYRARFYDPAVGSFISADPIGLSGGINVYAYVGSNPVGWTDPLGLTKEQVKCAIRFLKQHPDFRDRNLPDWVLFRSAGWNFENGSPRVWGKTYPVLWGHLTFLNGWFKDRDLDRLGKGQLLEHLIHETYHRDETFESGQNGEDTELTDAEHEQIKRMAIRETTADLLNDFIAWEEDNCDC